MKHNLYLQVLEVRFPFPISLLECSSVSTGEGSYKGDLWAQDMNKKLWLSQEECSEAS